MKWLIVLFLAFSNFLAFGNGDPISKTTVVSGIVIDQHSSESLTGVRVSVVGTDIFTFSDRDGNFILDQVPTGNIELSFQLVSFKPEVKNLNTTEVNNSTLLINLIER